MYEYRAEVLRVVDGDTLDVRIDVGFHMTTVQRLRLLGVNTPEKRASDQAVRERALAAEAFACEKLGMHLPFEQRPKIIITTEKDDAFGRWLANVQVCDATDSPTYCLNAGLLAEGHAVPYKRK